MPSTVVKIEWDYPDDTPGWLCADNIAVALSAHCKNTKFKVSEVEEKLTDVSVEREYPVTIDNDGYAVRI